MLRNAGWILAVAVCLAPACTQVRQNVGKPLPPDGELASLEVSRTTKAQALAQLGAPVSIRRQHDGDLLIWDRMHRWSDSIDILPVVVRAYHRTIGAARWDRLALLFDHDGVLAGLGLQRDIDPDGPSVRQGP